MRLKRRSVALVRTYILSCGEHGRGPVSARWRAAAAAKYWIKRNTEDRRDSSYLSLKCGDNRGIPES